MERGVRNLRRQADEISAVKTLLEICNDDNTGVGFNEVWRHHRGSKPLLKSVLEDLAESGLIKYEPYGAKQRSYIAPVRDKCNRGLAQVDRVVVEEKEIPRVEVIDRLHHSQLLLNKIQGATFGWTAPGVHSLVTEEERQHYLEQHYETGYRNQIWLPSLDLDKLLGKYASIYNRIFKVEGKESRSTMRSYFLKLAKSNLKVDDDESELKLEALRQRMNSDDFSKSIKIAENILEQTRFLRLAVGNKISLKGSCDVCREW